jgi:tRNA-dihydrouridine synthase 1
MSQTYRQDNFDAHAEDRPLVVQFCGDDPATLIAAAKHVEGKCDAIELNCGCPQVKTSILVNAQLWITSMVR